MIKRIINLLFAFICLVNVTSIAHADIIVAPYNRSLFYRRHLLEIREPIASRINTKTGIIKIYDEPGSTDFEAIKVDDVRVYGVYNSSILGSKWGFVNYPGIPDVRYSNFNNKYYYDYDLVNEGFMTQENASDEEAEELEEMHEDTDQYSPDYLQGRSDGYSDGYRGGKSACAQSIEWIEEYISSENSNYLKDKTGNESQDYLDGYSAGYSESYTYGYDEYSSYIVDRLEDGTPVWDQCTGYSGWVNMNELVGGVEVRPSILDMLIVLLALILIIFTVVKTRRNRKKMKVQGLYK